MILEPCSGKERINMDTSDNTYARYFYLHLPIIHELKVLVPFNYFEIELFATSNVSLSHITPKVWSMLRVFQIVCCSLGVPLVVRVFLSFFSTEILLNNSWVTLCSLLGSCLLNPFVICYEYCKDKFE